MKCRNTTPLRSWYLCLTYQVTFFFICVASIYAEDKPDPITLLQGVESVRLQVPPSSLKIKATYRSNLVTNETIYNVDFDGERRAYNLENQRKEIYKTLFNGRRAIVYNESIKQACYRNLNDETSNSLFDPRLIGLSTFQFWTDTIKRMLPYDVKPNKVLLIGKENVDGLPAWHVRIAYGKTNVIATWDYWIDDRNFRVYRLDYNGVETYSYYMNESFPWLPTRVIGKDYRGGDGHTVTSQRELEILEAKANVNFAETRWTLEGMRLGPGIDVIDYNISRSIGTWNGEKLIPNGVDFSERTKKKPGYFAFILCLTMLVFPMIILWILKARKYQDKQY
jgi:hypothetical protein